MKILYKTVRSLDGKLRYTLAECWLTWYPTYYGPTYRTGHLKRVCTSTDKELLEHRKAVYDVWLKNAGKIVNMERA